MGIENTALETIFKLNQAVMRASKPCVRFLCEKRCYTSQCQPMPALFIGCMEPKLDSEDYPHGDRRAKELDGAAA
jgi:hypothetical protein